MLGSLKPVQLYSTLFSARVAAEQVCAKTQKRGQEENGDKGQKPMKMEESGEPEEKARQANNKKLQNSGGCYEQSSTRTEEDVHVFAGPHACIMSSFKLASDIIKSLLSSKSFLLGTYSVCLQQHPGKLKLDASMVKQF